MACEYITKICVTTNDSGILAMNADFPELEFIQRPENLCGDEVSGLDPVLHAMSLQNRNYDYVLLLQPTSPLRTSAHLNQAIRQCLDGNFEQLVSVRESAENFNHVLIKEKSNTFFLKQKINADEYWVLNGAIYLTNWDTLLQKKNFINPKTEIFKMDYKSSVDIDTIEDWNRAVSYAQERES